MTTVTTIFHKGVAYRVAIHDTTIISITQTLDDTGVDSTTHFDDLPTKVKDSIINYICEKDDDEC